VSRRYRFDMMRIEMINRAGRKEILVWRLNPIASFILAHIPRYFNIRCFIKVDRYFSLKPSALFSVRLSPIAQLKKG
jgi:hypothetical protein